MDKPIKIAEIDELKRLISEGCRLKGLPEFNGIFGTLQSSGLAVPITSQIDNWGDKAIKLIYLLLPKAIINPYFVETANIYDSKIGKGRIIASGDKDVINKIVNDLEKCLSFLKWCEGFDETKLNAKQKAKFSYVPLWTIVEYTHKVLIPALMGLEDGKTKNTALLHLYGRIFLLAKSIVKLDNFTDCQLLTASFRTLLELYIDMLLIMRGSIDNGIEKFFSFDEIYKFNSAKHLLRIDEELNRPAKESSALKSSLENPEQKISLQKKLWGDKAKPMHWTNLTPEDRSRKAGELETFRNIYYYGNMYIHSGYIKFPETEDEACLLCTHVYGSVLEIFKNATELICNETHIAQKEEIIQETNMIYLLLGYFNLWKSLKSDI
jgi:hypothetical protein